MIYRKLPSGVQDVLPRECRILNDVKQRLAEKFTRCGFQPVLSADLEYYDTYSQIRNAVPQEHLFKLSDTDGRLLVLRPDMTLSISRIAATKLKEPCARLYYFANKWDLQSAGGLSNREIYQAGVECLGEEGAFSDAQAIAFAVECLKETGLSDFMIDVGHVGYFKGVLEECGLTETDAEEVRSFVNAKDGLNAERILKKAGAGKDILNTVLALPSLFGGAEVLDRAQALTHNAGAQAAIAHLKQVNALLKGMGYDGYICYDLGTVRRLSYYSGIVFSALVKEVGAPILTGGRYDNLADDFGKHIPAVGFAIGLKRVLVALERRGTLPKEEPVCTVVCDTGAEEQGYREFLRLTQGGVRARLSAECGRACADRERTNGPVYFVTKSGVERL